MLSLIRVGLAGSIVEMTLWMEALVIQCCEHLWEILVPPFIYHTVEWARERHPPDSSTSCCLWQVESWLWGREWENWHQPPCLPHRQHHSPCHGKQNRDDPVGGGTSDRGLGGMRAARLPLSAMWWPRWWKMPSLPLAGKRAGPWVTGWENWPCSPTGTVHGRVGNYLTWSATLEMTGCRWGGVRARELPLPSLVCHMMTKIREIWSLTNPLQPVTDRRASLGAWELRSGPWLSPRAAIRRENPVPYQGKQQSWPWWCECWWVGPEGVGAGLSPSCCLLHWVS